MPASEPASAAVAQARLRWLLPIGALLVVLLALLGNPGGVGGAGGLAGLGDLQSELLWSLRLPRVLCGFGVGALLALAGLAMQVLLRNPLADPYVLGTSSGAAVGAVAALIVAGGLMWLGAAVGALAAGLLLLALARGAGIGGSLAAHDDDASARLILTGAMIAALLGAVLTLLLTITPDARLRGAIFWLVGDLSGAQGGPWLLALAALAVLLLRRHALTVDRLMLGADTAWLLGEPVPQARRALLVGACLGTAAAVAAAGSIGFVGLVVPQALRRLGVRTTAPLAWMSALAGGALVVLADTVARTLSWPLELPVGAIMALLGAPVFIVLLARGAR